ncbi:MAG: amidase, partial [Gammaproteobacteria bacterium]
DEALAAGQDLGPLHGIPYVSKDLFDVAGQPTTAGTALLESNIASSDSTVIAKLSRVGMVLLGKTHTVQFAYGGAGINSQLGTPHNPWHATAHLPGGSSSGTGVAVAADLAPAGLGTDTGGSVRIPASFCGISGLKTTVGQVSRAGVYPLSFSLDSVGPLARSVEDLALLYDVLSGPDALDTSTQRYTHRDVAAHLERGVSGLRLAFAEGALFENIHADVERAVRACGEVFTALGANVANLDFQEAEAALELNPRGLVISAEAYAANQDLLERHLEALDPVVVKRMVNGKDLPAHQYIHTAQQWSRLRARTVDSLADVDALLCPTVMIPPLPVEQLAADFDTYAVANAECLRNTAIGNILDLCAVTVPCGFTGNGLPVGLMVYAKPFCEDMALRVAHAYQQATDWHLAKPDLSWASR